MELKEGIYEQVISNKIHEEIKNRIKPLVNYQRFYLN